MPRPENFPDQDTVAFNITMPTLLKAEIEAEARKDSRPFSSQLAVLCQEALSRRKEAVGAN